MQEYSGTIIEAQVDWLTVSAHGWDAADRLRGFALGLTKQEAEKGNKPRPWRMMGYDGTHCGQVEFGQRDEQSTQLRLIGDAANVHLATALSVADRVTRCDIALTWRAEPPDPFIGQNAYTMAEQHHQLHPRAALPSHTSDANGGYTMYLGNRASDNYLRIYNKGAEAVAKKDAEGIERYRACWRYELEAKATVASGIAHAVWEEPKPEQWIQNYLYEFAQRHGVEPAFPKVGSQRLIPGFRRRSDADSKLAHLSKNVRPTIDWLKRENLLDAARKALGLEEG